VLEIAFDRLALAGVVAHTLPANHASLAVMARLGMAYEREIEHAGAPHALYRVTAAGRRGTRDAQAAQSASRTADSRSGGTSTRT
jgi:RimJ/RimL family protein N-acetyltransferase